MTYSSKSDTWVSPCDLCGSLRHETMRLPREMMALRCRDCGLVTVPQREKIASHGQGPHYAYPNDLALAALHRLARGRSVLIIGTPPAFMSAQADAAGLMLTVLVEPGSGPVAGARTEEWSLDAASFPPDRFDLILCLNGLESFPAPSLLFERARYWLSPGGTLLVGALNFKSLPARMRRRNWLYRYAAGAEHLFSLDTLKGYAQRYGFGIRSVHTRSRIEEVASVITGNERSSWLMSVAAAPVMLAASALGMGLLMVVEMSKEGLALRPIRREPEEEMEGSPGLAPALYTSVQRKTMAECH